MPKKKVLLKKSAGLLYIKAGCHQPSKDYSPTRTKYHYWGWDWGWGAAQRLKPDSWNLIAETRLLIPDCWYLITETMAKKKSHCTSNETFVYKSWQRPTLPGGPSTIGAEGLNCSVRNGKRWNTLAIVTKQVRFENWMRILKSRKLKKKEAFGQLVLLSSIHYCTSTYSLST